MKALATVGIAALLGAGAVYYFGSLEKGGVAEAVPQPSAPAHGDPAIAGAMKAAVPAPEPKKKLPQKQRLYFPDGSWLPALNGATNAPAVDFRERPYAPVIGKSKDSSGREWYKHEDGSHSTTIMGWRHDLGRYDAITEVAHPTETRPLLLDEVVGPGGAAPPTKGGAPANTSGAGPAPKR